jgi:hypothetical protein
MLDTVHPPMQPTTPTSLRIKLTMCRLVSTCTLATTTANVETTDVCRKKLSRRREPESSPQPEMEKSGGRVRKIAMPTSLHACHSASEAIVDTSRQLYTSRLQSAVTGSRRRRSIVGDAQHLTEAAELLQPNELRTGYQSRVEL